MPISLRRVKMTDFIQLQNANLHCLAENYHMWFWVYHYLLSPQGTHVAVNSKNKILGYVLGKTDEDKKKKNQRFGSITSVAVYSGYRKLGLATKLLSYTHKSLRDCYHVSYINLHVRETNRAGQILYKNSLHYQYVKTEEGYYADGENAFSLRFTFPDSENSPPEKQ